MYQLKSVKKKNTILFSISNKGKEIPEDELESIFDKFYQSKNQNILKPKGSGLGLAISKQIIESHKGKIWAENIKKQGVKVSFEIPFYKSSKNKII